MREFDIRDRNGYLLQIGEKYESLPRYGAGFGVLSPQRPYGNVTTLDLFPLFQVNRARLSQAPLLGAP